MPGHAHIPPMTHELQDPGENHKAAADLTSDLAIDSLADRYDLARDRVYLLGTEAIVRLLLLQKARDAAAGLDTAGFISGYRGSPLGSLDRELQFAQNRLGPANIVFQPGLNEDLAATAIWGSQQAEMRGEGRHDGVFGLFYGKGPGIDRSGDVFRHANLAGTSPHGGVLVLMGDDHTAESSTTAHQSELHLVAVAMPILSPAGVQEIIDYGLYGYALSRYAGVWVGLKCVKETVESRASVDGSARHVVPREPEPDPRPAGGLHIRPRDPVLTQEARLQDHKLDAVLAWLRANKLDRIIHDGGAAPRLGLVSSGKSYLDTRQALEHLGLDDARCAALGVRLYKVACPWPLEPEGLKAFARGLDLCMVVEEKRALIETQVRELLYDEEHRPKVVGKRDEKGEWLFPVKGALDPHEIAIAIGERLLALSHDEALATRLEDLRRARRSAATLETLPPRAAYFCSGCPHNSSTKVPEGSRAYAGIGCHYMVQWMERDTEGFTQMGGEGANWIGEAPFSTRRHMFQNLGDGTYNHSGSLALRFAVSSGVDITYKILFNDAVAMTGGQTHDGGLTVDRMARQIAAEGVARIAVVTDEPDKYPPGFDWPPGVTIHPRQDFDDVQRELANIRGTSVLIFDQTCAAEKRRRRKRGAIATPGRRVFINERVCEGCGDCGVTSNCVSVQPLDTPLGRKRRIDQSSCNLDFSCLEGFCPSFVTLDGAKPKAPAKSAARDDFSASLPQPDAPALGPHPYAILVTGIGGTGIVTIGAVIGMAAHLDGRGCGVIDMAGIAQKGGAVTSHVRLAATPADIHAIRIASEDADLVLGCDIVVTASRKTLETMRQGRTRALVATSEVMPGDFARHADFTLPTDRMIAAIRKATGERATFIDANALSSALFGNTIAANMMMLGFAWQSGLVPLSERALLRAIELNGEAVPMNRAAFAWGRRFAADPARMDEVLDGARPKVPVAQDETLAQIIGDRAAILTAYQDAAYARRYRDAVERIAAVEAARAPGHDDLARATARYLFKLMAIKDEYEVARLHTDGEMARRIAAEFDGVTRINFHFAPPLMSRGRDGKPPRKISFGPWILPGLRLLAAMRRLRGSWLDVFGLTAERRQERATLAEYEALLAEIAERLDSGNHPTAVALASLPEKIRGYGHVRARHLENVEPERRALLARFRTPPPSRLAAE
ncbi:MAG: indolepyruvate ferredoxin oxidoreductase family protein [Beijerinckiaceae bacterium]|nr:indolepyruvate ferredoxin oxidoreductase family protein [Beijerinckiaceae bacterium]